MNKKISKTSILKKTKKKTNSTLVETIRLANKNNLLEVSKKLARPARMQLKTNLGKINEEAKEGETIMLPGKVLGDGDIDKKIKISAFSFSKSAKEKLEKNGCKFNTIKQEINENPTLKGVRII
jgi:large subunit ribosomal protein L18e